MEGDLLTYKHTIFKNQCAYLFYTQSPVCSSHVYYVVTHNVSSDQSPLIVNRTNVTLYGVQPGETYTVEIIPYSTKFNSGLNKFILSASVTCDPRIQQTNSCSKQSKGKQT